MENKRSHELITISSSELSSVIHSPLGETLKNPFARKIFLTNVRVAGIRYRENINELLNALDVGDGVILAREPENEYDELAIVVQNTEGQKLGYVPRANNDIPAHLMDAGKILVGTITELKKPDDREYLWNALSIDIYLNEGGNEPVISSGKSNDSQGSGFFSKISGLLHGPFSGGIHKPFSREIFLTHIPVLYNLGIKNLNRVLARMKVGDRVLLRRELDSEHDKTAIVVMNKRKRVLGYIPHSHSPVLAGLMEAGKHIWGVATDIEHERNGYGGHNSIIIDVFMED